ncbi:MAG: sugar ABC transporter permease [Clostridia bacterium]|nr:sugar ABC transporter permease [Clostridia bacterium]
MTDTKTMKTAAPKKKRRRVSLDSKKTGAGWLFVLPFVIGFVCIYLPVIINSLRYSFSEIRNVAGSGFETTFVGWDNYSYALMENPDYVEKLLESLQTIAFQIPAIVIFSLFIAIILNQKMIGRAAFRAIFFIPVIMSTGLIDEIAQNSSMQQYMDPTGMIQTGTEAGEEAAKEAEAGNQIVSAFEVAKLFENMAVGTSLVKYVVEMVNNIFDIVNRSGVQMLIFLAGLQSVSPAIYEPCSIDGASPWETLWKITLPMVSPMILVNAVYTVIDSFTAQDNVVMTFIKDCYEGKNGITSGKERSSAMAWIYFMIVAVVIGLVALILKKFVFYQRKE